MTTYVSPESKFFWLIPIATCPVLFTKLNHMISVVMSMLGAAMLKDTLAMKRRKELEPVVLSGLRKQIGDIM